MKMTIGGIVGIIAGSIIGVALIISIIIFSIKAIKFENKDFENRVKEGRDMSVDYINSFSNAIDRQKILFANGYKLIEVVDKKIDYYVVDKNVEYHNSHTDSKFNGLLATNTVVSTHFKEETIYALSLSPKESLVKGNPTITYQISKEEFDKATIGTIITLTYKKQIYRKGQ